MSLAEMLQLWPMDLVDTRSQQSQKMEDQILADACLPDGLGAGPHMDGWVEESEKYEGSGR